MIHQLFGISTETLLGWMMVLFVPAIFFTVLLVLVIQNRQLKDGQAYIAWRLGMGPAPRQRRWRRRSGEVIQGPWDRRSG